MTEKKLYWEVVNIIEKKINDGIYVVGSRLPPERILSEEYGVGRPTIRQAIIALEVMGKIKTRLNSGSYLLEQPKQEVISTFELTQARALIEGETAALAALNITEEELFDLEQCIEEMENGDPEKAEANFHLIIAKSTRNKAIVMAVKELWNISKSNQDIKIAYRNVCYRDDAKRLKGHQKILIALQNHQVKHARVAMREHLNP